MRERMQEPEELSSRASLQLMRRALRYMAPFKKELGVKMALLLFSFIPTLLLPWPARILIDQVVQGVKFGEQPTPFPFFVQPFVDALADASRTEILVWTLMVQFLLLVLVGAFGTDGRERDKADASLATGWDTATRTENEANSGFSEIGGVIGLFDFRWTMRLTQRLNHHYRSHLFERIHSLPMTSFDDERIGDAVYRVMYDTAAISATCYRILLTPIGAPINILLQVGVLGAVYGWNSPLMWAGLSFFGVALLPTLPFVALQRRYAGRSRRSGATTTSSIEETMNNMVAVQSLGGEDQQREQFAGDSDDSFRQYRYKTFIDMATFLAAAACGALIVGWVFLYIGDSIIAGRITLGDFFVVLVSFIVIAGSSVDLGAIWIRLQNEATGLNRVFYLMDAPAEDDPPDAAPLARVQERVEVEHVDFSYEPGTPTLRDVSFEARIGQVTAFAGPAGAGKTSIAYLIPRFLSPQRGTVRVDGTDIAGVTKDSLRSQIAFVFQETVLFDATVEENIKLGNPEATETEVRRAARIAGADEFIRRLPNGYATPLGRSGGKLSVGQKQRLSIARALVRNAPILILDEPTSALDPETEQRLVEALREAARTRIVIVIAHRLSTIREADQILFLERGAIIEHGNHAELMSRPDSAYRAFVDLQQRGVA